MINTALKAQIDSQITNETTQNGITPAEVGGNIKAVVDYVDQQVPYKSYKAVVNYNSVVRVFNDGIGLSSAIVTNPSNGNIIITKTGFLTGVNVSKIDFYSSNTVNSGQIFVTDLKQGGVFGENPDDKVTLSIFDMTGTKSSTPPSEITVEIRIYI